jgi:hypothetical protein
VWVDLAGQRRKCVLFTLRMPYSGKAVHRVYATASPEAFLEGHVEAFAVLGGAPRPHLLIGIGAAIAEAGLSVRYSTPPPW